MAPMRHYAASISGIIEAGSVRGTINACGVAALIVIILFLGILSLERDSTSLNL